MASAHIPMWNIDAPVGKNKPNKVDDVRLVQAMLIALIAASTRAPAIPGFRVSDNGIFDGPTEDLIKAFQGLMNKKYPGRYPPDGVVIPIQSPANVDWIARTANGTSSIMVALNFELRAISKGTHQSIGDKLKERLL